MKERLMIKLGGSVITDKSGDCSINKQGLTEIAGHIAGQKDKEIILIHGAGSCGHPEAKRHHLDKGLDQTNKVGIFITHSAVRKLNDAVVNALRASGMEAVGMHPLGACTAGNGRLLAYESRPLELLLQYGIIPVLHGDVVMDRERGACIISGDQLVSFLPQVIRIDRIGLATDVGGVLNMGNVVPRIDTETAQTLEIGESDNPDITGGMKGKIQELIMLAENGTESNIFHISRLRDFLDGREHGGTVVTQ